MLKILSVIALAIGIVAAVIFLFATVNDTLESAQKTPFIITMLIAFPAAILFDRLAKPALK